MANMIKVQIDEENAATTWWDALDTQHPAIATRLRNGATELTDAELQICEELPGWNDGPDYARTALIVG